MLYLSHDDSWSQEANGTATVNGPRGTFSDDTIPTMPTSAPTPAPVTPSPGSVVRDMLSVACNASQNHDTSNGKINFKGHFMLLLVALLGLVGNNVLVLETDPVAKVEVTGISDGILESAPLFNVPLL